MRAAVARAKKAETVKPFRAAMDGYGNDESTNMFSRLKRLIVGKALRTEQAIHERLSKKVALAVFSSDALSSTAYAPEEILLVFATAFAFGQAGAFGYVLPLSAGMPVRLIIGSINYRQPIHAPPNAVCAFLG